MFRYLVRVSKKGPSAHIWDGEDTACRMWKSGGLKARGMRISHHQLGSRLCKLCAAESGATDSPGPPLVDVNAALMVLEAPKGCGFKEKPKRPTKRERKKAAVEALQQKLTRPSSEVSRVDPRTDDFLSSFQWRRKRMEVLRHYGPKCMCCGATPETGAVMNVDHIKPRKTHPHLALDFDNLQVLCGDCNHGKGNWDTTDWRPAQEQIEPEVAAFIRSIARGG